MRVLASLLIFLCTTGCVVRSTCQELGTITFYWTFTDPTGRPFANCREAGVETVSITIEGLVYDFRCVGENGVEGIRLHDFQPGGYPFTLEGKAGGPRGQVLYVEQGTASAVNCGDTTVSSSLAAIQGDLTVSYTFNSQPHCTQQSTQDTFLFVEKLRYELYDASGQLRSAGEVPCDTVAHAFVIPSVPFGTHTFRFLQGLVYSKERSRYEFAYQACGVRVAHYQPSVLNIDLPAATSTTPVCP